MKLTYFYKRRNLKTTQKICADVKIGTELQFFLKSKHKGKFNGFGKIQTIKSKLWW